MSASKFSGSVLLGSFKQTSKQGEEAQLASTPRALLRKVQKLSDHLCKSLWLLCKESVARAAQTTRLAGLEDVKSRIRQRLDIAAADLNWQDIVLSVEHQRGRVCQSKRRTIV